MSHPIIIILSTSGDIRRTCAVLAYSDADDYETYYALTKRRGVCYVLSANGDGVKLGCLPDPLRSVLYVQFSYQAPMATVRRMFPARYTVMPAVVCGVSSNSIEWDMLNVPNPEVRYRRWGTLRKSGHFKERRLHPVGYQYGIVERVTLPSGAVSSLVLWEDVPDQGDAPVKFVSIFSLHYRPGGIVLE